ncbi:hypothetical protein QYF61_014434 [Mycteria americana]|uniref:Integrase catalytic domain-containing protein n=1 Tax=Mycteria americana TaxID=33587 RepID=A0AAN7RNM1_MYCAM|nr:hypothetical protein QYF61_014434 [Mycteria americana]
MVEATTGWLETYPVPHATTQNTILGLEKQVPWQHGTPERIESDNGTHFQNNLIDTWAKEHGIEWRGEPRCEKAPGPLHYLEDWQSYGQQSLLEYSRSTAEPGLAQAPISLGSSVLSWADLEISTGIPRNTAHSGPEMFIRRALFTDKQPFKNTTQRSALRLDSYEWQGVWDSMGKYLGQWAPPLFWNFTPEQVLNPEKLVEYLEKVCSHPGNSRETQITAM